MSQEAFVGRQPIVDRDRQVVAYEQLFRSSRTAKVADFSEKNLAALRVIANTFATLGEEAVLGGKLGGGLEQGCLAALRISQGEVQTMEHEGFAWLHALQRSLLG